MNNPKQDIKFNQNSSNHYNNDSLQDTQFNQNSSNPYNNDSLQDTQSKKNNPYNNDFFFNIILFKNSLEQYTNKNGISLCENIDINTLYHFTKHIIHNYQ